MRRLNQLQALALFGITARVLGATVVVNDSGDTLHDSGCAVTGAGACTFRDALAFANSNPGPDVIHFDLPGPGVHSIRPTSFLQQITDNAGVTIDGYSQSGATPNTLARGDDANILVELDGSVIPSGFTGLLTISSDNNLVRGLIINNYGISASLAISGSGNVVTGCFLGTDPTGEIAEPSRSGVEIIGGGGNRIGGTDPASRNVIIGSSLNVVDIFGSGSNVVQGNYIGTNRDGTASMGAFFHGIAVASDGNLIGGLSPGAGNLVSGNGAAFGNGILVVSSGNTISGNFVGTDRDGVAPVPNGGHGIRISENSNSNKIQGNTIAFNGESGIAIGTFNDAKNRISQNSIFSNGRLGIDLSDGRVVQNDPCDADDGPNLHQNYPVLTESGYSPVTGTTHVTGTLNSTPNTVFEIELFDSPSCNPSFHGEGKTYLGSLTVATDGSCTGTFNVHLPVVRPELRVLTATATDPDGNTSEFSQCFVPRPPIVSARKPGTPRRVDPRLP